MLVSGRVYLWHLALGTCSTLEHLESSVSVQMATATKGDMDLEAENPRKVPSRNMMSEATNHKTKNVSSMFIDLNKYIYIIEYCDFNCCHDM